MRAPKRFGSGRRGETSWVPPDEEWLRYHYLTLEKSLNLIAHEVGLGGGGPVRRWLRKIGVPCRSLSESHALIAGERHPNWISGRGSGTREGILRRAGRDRSCAWCGQGPKGSNRLEIHHKDHNADNNVVGNLVYLCRTCHMLECRLWYIHQTGKAVVDAEGDTITIQFPHLTSK